jgi:hypothetical protein
MTAKGLMMQALMSTLFALRSVQSAVCRALARCQLLMSIATSMRYLRSAHHQLSLERSMLYDR